MQLHLKEAPKNAAERQHRREHEHLDAAAGVDGIEAFYDRCLANGVTILRPLTATAWGMKDFYIEDPDGLSSRSAAVRLRSGRRRSRHAAERRLTIVQMTWRPSAPAASKALNWPPNS